jgi:gamma-glutamyltranspeptidase/glutathione hydrolase
MNIRKSLLALAFGALSFAPSWASQEGSGLAVPQEPGFRGGVVAVSHPLAAEAGAKMLREGGNAIDAAAAIQFALNVVEPEFSGIGGGGFMMVHLAGGQGRTFVVEGREKAPATADTTLFTNPDGTNQGFTPASTSGQAVGVPGTLMVVATAVQRYGRKRLADVIQPAIALAENGFPINFVLAGSINAPNSRTLLYQATRDVFRPGGVPVQQGQILKQPDLAKTLRLIAAHGPDVFYRGEIAPAIVAAQLGTANGGKPGLMTLQDLADYNIVIREPIVGEYRGYRIASMSPPSSGGLTMIQALKMVERFPLGDIGAGFGSGKANTLHVMAEAMRIAWSDRAVWMGDEDFVEVPKRGLLHPTYVSERGSMITLGARIPGTVPFGDPWPFEVAQRPGRTRLAAAEPVSYPGGSTTHFSVADQWGNVVSYTTTIEAGWGTGITVPGYGFLLNNELTDFNFGFNMHPRFGGPGANDVQGGKRPRSSMTPTILFKGNEPVAAFGSPGGASIINSVFNVMINLIDHGMTIQQAVDAPRISVTTAGNGIAREAGFEPAEIAKLQALGHSVGNPGNIGNVNAIFIDLASGRQFGAVDSTREGGLIGFTSKRNDPLGKKD